MSEVPLYLMIVQGKNDKTTNFVKHNIWKASERGEQPKRNGGNLNERLE